MTIPFSQISPTRRIPLYLAEFTQAAQVGVADFTNPSIVLAQKTPASSATAGQRYLIGSEGEAASLFGAGSPAHLMCRAFLDQHPTARLYCAAQTDADSGTAASTTLTFTGPATAGGTIYLYICGVIVEVGVSDDDTANTIAAAVVSAVTALTSLPCTAAVGANPNEHVVTFTAKVEGTVGNQLTIALNALGQAGGQSLPAGVGATIASSYTLPSGGVAAVFSGGATDPTATAWGDSLGDDPFDDIAFQTDSATAVGDLLETVVARWNANSAKDGRIYIAKADSKADLITYYGTRNDERLSVMSYPEAAGWLTPAFIVAAAYAGVAARELANDPAAPIQGLPLVGVWANGTSFSDADRDTLAYEGGATMTNRNGIVAVEFEGTTRREDQYGSRDASAEDIQVPAIRSRLRRRIGQATQAAYPRHKLADDGVPIAGGQRIVTPQIYRAFIKSLGAEFVRDGLIESTDAIVVERNASNQNRLDTSIDIDAINRARVFAMNIRMGA